MQPISYARHRFRRSHLRHYLVIFAFYVELTDVEELLAERGLEVSYQTAR
jgi:transposase-like protein